MRAIYPDLKNKIVLITGASRGIGKAIALHLAEQGAHIVFNYRGEKEKVISLVNEIEKLGGKATPILFDVTDFNQMKISLEQVTKDVGAITGVINNAGISKDQLLLRLKESDIDQILDTNLKSAMMVTQLLTRTLMKAENVSLINISSIVGLMGNPAQAAYAASKAGLIGFTKSVAKELASRNVRANVICPGFIETDMTALLDEKVKATYLQNIPLGRMGNASEVAELCAFLLSSASSYLTGEVIKIDGGLYM